MVDNRLLKQEKRPSPQNPIRDVKGKGVPDEKPLGVSKGVHLWGRFPAGSVSSSRKEKLFVSMSPKPKPGLPARCPLTAICDRHGGILLHFHRENRSQKWQEGQVPAVPGPFSKVILRLPLFKYLLSAFCLQKRLVSNWAGPTERDELV